MIDNTYLKELLSNLKLYSVKRIKMQGLEIEFLVEQGGILGDQLPATTLEAKGTVDPDSTQIIAEALRKQEEAMPPDLRADALMDQDNILNWSSPDQKAFEEEPEMPLTGEQPL